MAFMCLVRTHGDRSSLVTAWQASSNVEDLLRPDEAIVVANDEDTAVEILASRYPISISGNYAKSTDARLMRFHEPRKCGWPAPRIGPDYYAYALPMLDPNGRLLTLDFITAVAIESGGILLMADAYRIVVDSGGYGESNLCCSEVKDLPTGHAKLYVARIDVAKASARRKSSATRQRNLKIARAKKAEDYKKHNETLARRQGVIDACFCAIASTFNSREVLRDTTNEHFTTTPWTAKTSKKHEYRIHPFEWLLRTLALYKALGGRLKQWYEIEDVQSFFARISQNADAYDVLDPTKCTDYSLPRYEPQRLVEIRSEFQAMAKRARRVAKQLLRENAKGRNRNMQEERIISIDLAQVMEWVIRAAMLFGSIVAGVTATYAVRVVKRCIWTEFVPSEYYDSVAQWIRDMPHDLEAWRMESVSDATPTVKRNIGSETLTVNSKTLTATLNGRDLSDRMTRRERKMFRRLIAEVTQALRNKKTDATLNQTCGSHCR